ncbi:hypothetical protein QAD02_001635 [Eretmocerus hayati]|uniref:Uncharacterized protein n=1 Tax=Eretmocerus hayati TaxID=131215 RepID=A0ACC2NIC9_9HYME|nr:hypothetical protein QAD02_001635 [Eretmocerus hayati]
MAQTEGGLSKKCTEESLGGFKLPLDLWEKQRLMQDNQEMSQASASVNESCHSRCILVHTLVMIFGTSAWIGVNGIFIQLPLLVNPLPEKWGLAAYLVIIIQLANVAPVMYGLLRRFSCRISESNCISVMLVFASVVMGLLAFWYEWTFIIFEKERSLALFILTFFTAAVSCSSSVLFMPYLRNFKEVYLVSYFIGEGLSGVMPSIVALIQGIDESLVCNNTNQQSISEGEETLPRFSSKYYFLFLCTCLCVSFFAFLILDKLPYLNKEKISSQELDNKLLCNEIQNNQVLSKNSITQMNEAKIDTYNKTDIQGIPINHDTQKNHSSTLDETCLYILLGVVCFLANGFLPSLMPYSCLSYGNMTYHLSTTFSQIANPTACLFALWFLPQGRKIIIWLSLLISFSSCYIIYLALVSSNAPLRDSDLGVVLVILSWIIVVALISYMKLIITSVFRRKSEETLFGVGIVMQAGSACGAVLSFLLINFTSLLQRHDPCESLNNT